MAIGNTKRRIGRTVLICAWLSCVAAHSYADFEIESFTRYRLIRLDNNNNGYVDGADGINPTDNLESYAVAETIDKSGSLGPFTYIDSRLAQQFAPPGYNRAQTGWGAVHVNFRTPDGFLLGIVDYNQSPATGTSVVMGADGFVDEIVSLPRSGVVVVSDTAGNSTFGVDYGDLHTFNISFERMHGTSYMQSRGVQLERVFRLRSKVREGGDKEEHSQSTWEIFYGVRFYQFDDTYTFDANGGIVGRAWAQTSVDNQHGGPHLGAGWNVVRGPWTFALSGLIQAGLASADASQFGAIGEDLSPGQINSLIFAQPDIVNTKDDDQFGSLYGELRAQAARQITDQLTASVGCSGYYFGDMKYADDSINWSMPEFGLAHNGTDDELVTTAFAGLEFRH